VEPLRPNFDWITDRLAVGGGFPPHRTRELARSHKIRAVVDLRAEGCDDESLLRAHGIGFLHLPTEDHAAVSQSMLGEGVAFVNKRLDRGDAVLAHCEHGIGRSALLALCVLVSRGFAPIDALELAKAKRPLVSPSPAQYHAWVEWLEAWSAGRSVAWQPPGFDAFAAIAYRHLRAG
jgi:hypothetical protein